MVDYTLSSARQPDGGDPDSKGRAGGGARADAPAKERD